MAKRVTRACARAAAIQLHHSDSLGLPRYLPAAVAVHTWFYLHWIHLGWFSSVCGWLPYGFCGFPVRLHVLRSHAIPGRVTSRCRSLWLPVARFARRAFRCASPRFGSRLTLLRFPATFTLPLRLRSALLLLSLRFLRTRLLLVGRLFSSRSRLPGCYVVIWLVTVAHHPV